ncbi:Tn3 family transposase [Spirillospora sp. NPDC029432]|uniref:Tn3 family transposase n=1 Tax=Spirillospora sp. NPDC029432 TaxID=3154599 RepID=UPI0034544E00
MVGDVLRSWSTERFDSVRRSSLNQRHVDLGYKRGITLLNAVNDQVMGIGQRAPARLPVHPRLPDQHRRRSPARGRHTDHASDSDMVFGIFSMLGYRFAPRFADLGDQRFWRADLPDGTSNSYGPLEASARQQDQPAEDPHPVAGHDPGHRIAGHQPGPGL